MLGMATPFPVECDEWSGPGMVTKNGTITGAEPGTAWQNGTIYIDRSQLQQAEAHGWRLDGKMTSQIVRVTK